MSFNAGSSEIIHRIIFMSSAKLCGSMCFTGFAKRGMSLDDATTNCKICILKKWSADKVLLSASVPCAQIIYNTRNVITQNQPYIIGKLRIYTGWGR